MTYLPQPYYLDNDEMARFILAIPETGWTWAPIGVTWHNTGAPTLKQWDAYPDAVKAGWGANLDHYYKFDQGWHAGPHAAGTPDKSFVLGEFRANGVHASCYNFDHFGVETVGDFRTGSDDPLSGRGLLSMQASANIIAALCIRMKWSPYSAINFHRECTRDGHACPGNLVTDTWAIGLVVARMKELGAAIPVTPAPAPSVPPTVDPALIRNAARNGTLKLDTVADLQRALDILGAPLAVDGSFGPATERAVKAFQQSHSLAVDGDPGPLTKAAILQALAA